MSILNVELYQQDLSRICEKFDLSELKGKSIIVTGGTGLIGSAIVDVLQKYNEKYGYGIKIIVAGRNKSMFDEKYSSFKDIEFLVYDALEMPKLSIECDYIISGAGLSSPELYGTMPVETLLSNINGTLGLLNYAKEHNVKKLVYVSSSEVYGKKETDSAFLEGEYGTINIDAIRSSYSVAKISSEMLCKSYAEEYGVQAVIVRPGHIYGPTATEKDKRVSSSFAFDAAHGKNLELKSTGLQKRSYCYCLDAALGILLVMLKGVNGEAYNIGSEKSTTIKEMAEIYADAGNVYLKSVEPTEEEAKVFNPMNNSSLDITKLKGLGYSDTFTAKEGLAHTVEILKETCYVTQR